MMAQGPCTDDEGTTVAQLKEAVRAFARERDWERFHTPKNLSMALAAEAAELMEHFLWASSESSIGPAREEAVADELADVVIYALEFANVADLDLARAIDRKMARNAEKYPVEACRGKALKYTELPSTGDRPATES